MRETDSRIAKYSRRGLVANILAYLLCLSLGYLTALAPIAAVVLTVGLIITTLLRAYVLIRFDSLYDRGPARWRDHFFVVTLIGAIWWSVILVTFTLILGMVAETPVLWLYTVIFFSTTLHVTSPFKRFSQIYQAIALLPPIVAVFFIGGFEGYMYGVMMLAFLLILHHQAENLHNTHWERLESNYALKQKAKVLESEKRNIDASVDLNSEFLTSLGHEFRTSLNDILGGLSLLTDSQLDSHQQELLKLAQKAGERQLDLVNNIVDFSKANNRKIVLDHNVFNLRSQLEQWLCDLSVDAHQQSVELEYQIPSSFPLRATGDAHRIGQIIKILMGNAIKFSEQGFVLVDIDFVRDSERGGQLKVGVTDQLCNVQKNESSTIINDRACTRAAGLWLTICKGLAECMGGCVEVVTDTGRETLYRFRLPLTVSGQQSASFNSHPKLQDKKLLFISPELSAPQQHTDEMRGWGISINVESDYLIARQQLDRMHNTDHGYCAVVINLYKQVGDALAFSEQLLSHQDYCQLPQIFLLSHNDFKYEGLQNQIDRHDNLHYLYRPLIRQALHDLLVHSLFGKPLIPRKSDDMSSNQHLWQGRKILLVDDHRVNQMIAESMLKKLGYHIHLAANGNEALQLAQKEEIDLILMDCQMPEMDGFEATRRIRKLEQASDSDIHIPIIAMTAHTNDEDQSLCFACGMDDYLAKPVHYDVLESHLLRWLGRTPE